jgi:hypothetical protein
MGLQSEALKFAIPISRHRLNSVCKFFELPAVVAAAAHFDV